MKDTKHIRRDFYSVAWVMPQFSPYGQTDDLGVRSKGLISLNFGYHVNSKIFIPNFVCVLTIKDRKPIEQNIYSVVEVMPQGRDFGVLVG